MTALTLLGSGSSRNWFVYCGSAGNSFLDLAFKWRGRGSSTEFGKPDWLANLMPDDASQTNSFPPSLTFVVLPLSLKCYSYLILYLCLSLFSAWIGATNLGLSHFLAPLLVALCRRKSTRLTAVVGGLVMALALLFASFARFFHQIFLRYVQESQAFLEIF